MVVALYRLHTTIVFSFLFFVKMTHFESLKTYALGSFVPNHYFFPQRTDNFLNKILLRHMPMPREKKS